ncbi:MAG: BNR-4 repeat-containing protein [Armatimonadota bacterium]|nr:BNR-4 repeat-containing protein [Armatimonadota bacterium]
MQRQALVALLGCAAALGWPREGRCEEGIVEVVPGLDERGAANEVSRIDLRQAGPEELAAVQRGLTTRLYGPRGPRNMLTFVTDLPQPGLLALDVRAASAGGADLGIGVADRWYVQSFRGRETIQVGALYGVPVPAGLREMLVKAVRGTVVVDRYLLIPDRKSGEELEMTMLSEVEVNLGAADGFHGIWYANQPLDSEYAYKYSGGLGTYCAKHIPFAIYSPEADRTFFVYGGTSPGERNLLIMASCYDHATGMVRRPMILLDKRTSDAHDNPVISLDDDGHVWVFASAHGTARPSYILRSREPHSVEAFEVVDVTNFSYPQVHRIPEGFFFFQTLYHGGRILHFRTSPDGRSWSQPVRLAAIEQGHYQVSNVHGRTAATAFNYHPDPRGLNWRTNLYYMASDDLGETWRNAAGDPIEIPLTEAGNPALVHDYAAEDLLVYMKDLTFDAAGRPIILIVTSPGFESGPQNDPRAWTTVHWTGEQWRLREITTSDNNYDTGCLLVGEDGSWTVIGPTETGPQPYNPGGEVAMWRSTDEGGTWTMVRQLTHDSPYNHSYVRRVVNGRGPLGGLTDFVAFWADGHGRRPSESRLYFADREGNVRRLPQAMDGQWARPEPVE